MPSIATPLPQTLPSRSAREWSAGTHIGRALTALAVVFLTFDALGKLLRATPVVRGTVQIGFSPGVVAPLGAVLLASVVAYAIPSTSVLGAILLTGYLGGAVATHVRLGDPFFSHVLVPVYVAALVWGGLVLRDRRVREVLPFARGRDTHRSAAAPQEQAVGVVMDKVISKDGTAIAFERVGSGPPLVLVDGALCSRAFGPMPELARQLAPHFTVFLYDRRGRGASGDHPSYAREREVEDLAALVDAAGGSAFVLGLSSGAALALEAAASGVNIRKLAAYEPPYFAEGRAAGAEPDHEGQLRQFVGAGKRGAAVKYFMRGMVGVPAPFVFVMQLMRGTWRKLEAAAHTLPYDAAVMGNWSLPAERFASIRVPVVAMYGGKTDARLQRAARAVAGAVRHAEQHVLAGQSHDVKPEVLSEAIVRLFAPTAERNRCDS